MDDAPHECPVCSLYRRTRERIKARVDQLKASALKERQLGKACSARADAATVGGAAWMAEARASHRHMEKSATFSSEAIGMLKAMQILQQERASEAHP